MTSTTSPAHDAPRRVLIVSADMGGGHAATARALREVVQQRWPSAAVEEVDTLDAMGPGVGPLFRWIYVSNVNTTPWLYDFFYHSLVHRRWFAQSSKAVVGAWSGRALRPVMARVRPDLVLSTYPLGTAGLQWLRTHDGQQAPVGAWVSDAAPHPFWVYRDVDLHLVVHEEALAPALAAEPDAAVAVCAPMVTSRFHPGGPDARRRSREELGLAADPLTVLVSTGVYGFGDVAGAVDAALAASEEVCVLVACGRNEALRASLARRGLPPERLRALGWVEDVPSLLRAVDVVVTNAGGATSLEALACGTPVLMHDPIAGHGRANAALMARAGLALLCPDDEDLRRELGALAHDRGRLEELVTTVREHVGAHDLVSGVERLVREGSGGVGVRGMHGARAGGGRGGRVAAADALFLHAETPRVAQHVGAVVRLDDAARPLSPEALRAVVRERLPAMPVLARRTTRGGRLRWPRWVTAPVLDVADHVDAVAAHGPQGVAAAVDAFFSQPLDLARPPWALRLVHGDGPSLVLVKVHHAVGDGTAVTTVLDTLLDPAAHPGTPAPEPVRDRVEAGVPGPPGTPAPCQWLVRGQRLVRGLWLLALRGAAGPSEVSGTLPDARRHVVLADLPGHLVRATARRHRVATTDLMLSLVAGALHRCSAARAAGEASAPDGADRAARATHRGRLHVVVPVALPATGGRGARAGNATGAARVLLPVGTMTEVARVRAVREAVAEAGGHGQPEAARLVVRALGALPWGLHARAAGAVYRARWFHAIVTVAPGRQRPRALAGVPAGLAHPVVPLADGVALAVALMPWGRSVAVGITVAPGLVPWAEELPAALRAVLDELAAGRGADHEEGSATLVGRP